MNYRIVQGTEHIKIEDVIRLLKMTYWADKRPVELIEKSMKNSDCYGLYLDNIVPLVGFARVISDYATTYYLCDVVIDTEYRRKGLGTALMSYIESMPEYKGLRGVLITRDAQTLYQKFGFEVLNDRAMVKQKRD
ncbi:GNAT family N-acetyltransferase [Anaerovibrio sp. JC8]|uniref:GNAT family N-acetyltransferase n=1 Tax=Anaerovibrio sp. JC8 TaxID=1240085 RepID=UPI000A12225C|nr:GNAT family N-acetyltransferase [Anaerovibrio sp. JC8]